MFYIIENSPKDVLCCPAVVYFLSILNFFFPTDLICSCTIVWASGSQLCVYLHQYKKNTCKSWKYQFVQKPITLAIYDSDIVHFDISSLYDGYEWLRGKTDKNSLNHYQLNVSSIYVWCGASSSGRRTSICHSFHCCVVFTHGRKGSIHSAIAFTVGSGSLTSPNAIMQFLCRLCEWLCMLVWARYHSPLIIVLGNVVSDGVGYRIFPVNRPISSHSMSRYVIDLKCWLLRISCLRAPALNMIWFTLRSCTLTSALAPSHAG